MLHFQNFEPQNSEISLDFVLNASNLVKFLENNPNARVVTDVLTNEVTNRGDSPLFKYAQISNQVIITPHIGGMTLEAQEIAYGHAANRLLRFFNGNL